MTVGTFSTAGDCSVDFVIPEISLTATCNHDFHVHTGTLGNYDMIIGRDLLASLGLDISSADDTIKSPRMHAELPMRPVDCDVTTSYHVEDTTGMQDDVDMMSRILDAKYTKADLEEIT